MYNAIRLSETLSGLWLVKVTKQIDIPLHFNLDLLLLYMCLFN